jgi:hypothetical protein
MNFVVIGTDHRMQDSEAGLEGLLRAWLAREFFEPLEAIAEEHSDREHTNRSIGQRLARERGLHWYNLDMTSDEKYAAGIMSEQRSRPISEDGLAFRVHSDDLREAAWVKKLIGSGSGTTLVICGYLHFEPLVRRLRAQGYAVDKRVYLETVPEIRTV